MAYFQIGEIAYEKSPVIVCNKDSLKKGIGSIAYALFSYLAQDDFLRKDYDDTKGDKR